MFSIVSILSLSLFLFYLVVVGSMVKADAHFQYEFSPREVQINLHFNHLKGAFWTSFYTILVYMYEEGRRFRRKRTYTMTMTKVTSSAAYEFDPFRIILE